MTPSLHLVCPHCLATNRLPSTRLEQSPKCGQCHQPLFDGHPIELTSEQYAEIATMYQNEYGQR